MALRYRHGASFPPSNFDSVFSNSDKLSWILQVEKLKLKHQIAKNVLYFLLTAKRPCIPKILCPLFPSLNQKKLMKCVPKLHLLIFQVFTNPLQMWSEKSQHSKGHKVLQEHHWAMSATTLTLLPVEEGPLIIGVRGNISAIVLRTRQFSDNPFYNFIMT